jgi:hypothetical protein
MIRIFKNALEPPISGRIIERIPDLESKKSDLAGFLPKTSRA